MKLKNKSAKNVFIIGTGALASIGVFKIASTIPEIKSITILLNPKALIPFLEVPVYWIWIIVLAELFIFFIPNKKEEK